MFILSKQSYIWRLAITDNARSEISNTKSASRKIVKKTNDIQIVDEILGVNCNFYLNLAILLKNGLKC